MPLFDLFWAMLWFFLLFAWIWLLISVFIDIFRSDDMGGWGKAAWAIFVIIVPLLGVLIYLIARGGSMQERRVGEARAQQQATNEYIRSASGGSDGVAEELTKLSSLRDSGAITDAEYETQKAKLLV
jgi:hypothetical protein